MFVRIIAGAALGCVILPQVACRGGMQGVDRRIAEAMEQRAQAMGLNRVPSRAWPRIADDAPPAVPGERLTERTPETRNPPASALGFEQADADRDVAARLADYTDEAFTANPATALMLDFSASLRIAQQSSRDFLRDEEEYILAAIRYLIERHRWTPRLFNDTAAALAGAGDDGRFETALSLVNELRVTQQLPFGGTAEAAWLVRATQELRDQVDDEYVQSSELALSASIPLLRDAGLIAQESLIQSERNLIYAARQYERNRRELVVAIAANYFSLLETIALIESQSRQLERQLIRLEETRQKVQAGRIAPFNANIVSSDVLNAESRLAGLRDQLTLQLERFKIRLGLDPDAEVVVVPFDLELPEPEISPAEAAERALAFRLDLQNQRDFIIDARRDVANARNQLLPDLDVNARVTLPTDPDEQVGGVGFEPGETSYSLGVTFGLPLDREIERLGVRSAMIALERAERGYTEFRDSVIVDARQAVRELELARFQLRLAEEQVRINEQRLREQEIKRDEVTSQEFNDTEQALLASQDARDRALTDLRNAILRYLLQTGQLRVDEAGVLKLPGSAELAPEA